MTFIVFLFSLTSCVGQSKQTNEMIVKDFVESLVNNSITNDEIREKFLTTKPREKSELDFINTHLQYAREELYKSNIKANEFRIVPYSDINEAEKTIIVPEDKAHNVFMVYYKNNNAIPILIENNK